MRKDSDQRRSTAPRRWQRPTYRVILREKVAGTTPRGGAHDNIEATPQVVGTGNQTYRISN